MAVGGTPPPFSARYLGTRPQIDEDFPQSARIGLLHILDDGVRKHYLEDWRHVLLELQRIGREEPNLYDSEVQASALARIALKRLPWHCVYDFCERLYNFLAKAHGYRDNDGEWVESVSRVEAQGFFANELLRLFLEENLAYEFKNGVVERRGRRHTVEQMGKANVVLGDARLESARKHFTKAQRYFRDAKNPDPENTVKEAVCAVEAAAKELFPESKAATLDGSVDWLTRTGKLPRPLEKTFIGLYGFRNGGEGIGHGATGGAPATMSIAEYALAVAASNIILLFDIASAEDDSIPF